MRELTDGKRKLLRQSGKKKRLIREDEEKTDSLIIQRPDALSLTRYPKQSKREAQRRKKEIQQHFCQQRPLAIVVYNSCILYVILLIFLICVSSVLRKGQVVTGYYRWLQRRGGYLWVQSCATVSINHKAPHERNVIWVNYILRSAL